MSNKVASLLEISDYLDRLGLQKEADLVDSYIFKIAAIPVALDDLPFLARLARIALDIKDLPPDGTVTSRITLPLVNKPIHGAIKRHVLRAMGQILSLYIRNKMYPKQETMTDPTNIQEYDDFIEVVEDTQELLAQYGSRESEDRSLSLAFGEINKIARKLAGNLERAALSLAHVRDDDISTQQAAELGQQFQNILRPLFSALKNKDLNKVMAASKTLESAMKQLLPEQPSGPLAEAVVEGTAALSQREKQQVQREVLQQKGVLEDIQSHKDYLDILTKQRTKLRNSLQGPMIQMRKYNQKIKGTFLDKPSDTDTGLFVDELRGTVTAGLMPPESEVDPEAELPTWLRAPSAEEIAEPTAPSGAAEARIGTTLNAFKPQQWTEIQKSAGAEEAKWLRKAIKDNYLIRHASLHEVTQDIGEIAKVIESRLAEHTPDTKLAEWDYWKKQDVEAPVASIIAATTSLQERGQGSIRLQEQVFDKFGQLLEWEK